MTSGTGYHIQMFSQTTSDPVRWRLLSGNNREIGRGAIVHADAETCRVAIKEVQAGVEEMEGRLRRVRPSAWIWELLRGGELIAFAGHPFDRMIRCRQGLQQFTDQVVEAPVAPVLIVSGARRWGSVSR
jgi:hypothetical protein